MNNERGFTLIEFLIAFAIFLIIVGALVAVMRDFFSANTHLEQSFLGQRQAQVAVQNMVDEIREAAPSDLGAYPLELAATNSIAFYSNVDFDPSLERVQYFLDGTNLRRSIVDAGGQPLTYSTSTGGQESLKTVLNDVRINPAPLLFNYRASFATSAPSSTPAYTLPIDQVRIVGIRIVIDKSTSDPVPPFTVTGVSTMRNLKTY